MADNALERLTHEGVAIWLDDLSRERLQSGSLARLIRDKHVVGVTTNPTIFQKAITGGKAYHDSLRELAGRGADPEESLRMLTTSDVRSAADLFRPAHEASGGVDGWVSIEVDPRLAHDTKETVAEARRLWWRVGRPNVLVKIPATTASLPAISACLAEGINVNVTLIFSVARYRQVFGAFLEGMERAQAAGLDLTGIASVASFFVSRIDTEVDRRLDEVRSTEAAALRGRAAIANARLAFHTFEAMLASPRWTALASAGARSQRPLWASTGVKDPAYDDTRYVTELVTRGVVNTMPEATLDAVLDHGVVRGDTVRGRHADAGQVMSALADLGVDLTDVGAVLERRAVETFESSWSLLLASVGEALDALQPQPSRVTGSASGA